MHRDGVADDGDILMAKKPFAMTNINEHLDKRIGIYGPDELYIEVDYDDVNHSLVKKGVKKMLKILNEHWESEE